MRMAPARHPRIQPRALRSLSLSPVYNRKKKARAGVLLYISLFVCARALRKKRSRGSYRSLQGALTPRAPRRLTRAGERAREKKRSGEFRGSLITRARERERAVRARYIPPRAHDDVFVWARGVRRRWIGRARASTHPDWARVWMFGLGRFVRRRRRAFEADGDTYRGLISARGMDRWHVRSNYFCRLVAAATRCAGVLLRCGICFFFFFKGRAFLFRRGNLIWLWLGCPMRKYREEGLYLGIYVWSDHWWMWELSFDIVVALAWVYSLLKLLLMQI